MFLNNRIDLAVLYALYETSSNNIIKVEISDHQQSWGYEEGPWKGPGRGHPLLVIADW